MAMPFYQEPAELPDGFAGIVRLFPLPNLVLFPHVVQALHIFEPRYREMLEDALAGDQLISLALLQPGWEPHYEQRPPIYPVACIGRVVAHARLEDGRYNILLHGLKRATVIREFPPDHSFRLAEVAQLDDLYPADGGDRRARIERDLMHTFQQLVPDSPAIQEQFEQLMSRQLPLGVLADVVAYTLPLEVQFKQQLLAEWNVDARAEQLLARLQLLAEQPLAERGTRPFPPDFSTN
jgi:ATP-dependent Lon protease